MQYIRRLIWFIASHLVLFCVLIGMLICGFFMCMDMANIYIILDEGLEKRAEVILTRNEAEELNKYFHYDFLNVDPAIKGAFNGSSAYDDYVISGFDYDLKIERLWAWPWDDYATCTVVEQVPSITGKVVSIRADEVPSDVPKWQGGRYNITLVKDDGLWKIIGMQQTAVIMESDEETDDKEQLYD